MTDSLYDLTLQLSDVAAVPLHSICGTPAAQQMAVKAHSKALCTVYNFRVKLVSLFEQLNNCSVDLFSTASMAENLLFC